MSEEYVEVEVDIDQELADKINKMSKKELVSLIFNNAVSHKNEVMDLDSKIDALLDIEQNLINQLKEGVKLRIRRVSELETKLDKAEAYVEQGRAMIESVMSRWYEYDV